MVESQGRKREGRLLGVCKFTIEAFLKSVL